MSTTINPYTKTTLNTYKLLSDFELDQTLEKSNIAYLSWKNTSLDDREILILKLKEQLKEQQPQLAELISTEMGKPLQQSFNEIDKCIELITYYAQHFKTFLTPKKIEQTATVIYQPTGAVLGIMPWNFPFWQVFRYAIPNILAGNICLLKHAPNTFGCGIAIETLFLNAGFPKHTFKNLCIDVSQVEKATQHSVTQGVCVTGSTQAGSAVAALAGKHLKPSVLELGGTDASILLEDADFTTALQHTINARLLNAGQICIAPKRIFVPKNKLDDTIALCLEKIKNVVLGNPLDPFTTMGPIAKADFIPILEQQVTQAISLGANLITGGSAKAPFYEPTLLILNADNKILEEEIFGPVICVIPYEHEDELISLVNQTKYGLGAAIWSKDTTKATAFATQIDVGYVAINQIVKSDPKYPFGGIKHSGYGKELGEQGFKTFLNAKTITIAN